MEKTSIQKLGEFGQSAWLDNISRDLIKSGNLHRLIGKGLLGMTSNPTIFDKAISQSSDYDKRLVELANDNKTAFEIYDELTIKDIQDAADILKSVYEKSSGKDGYVSLEINPMLAMKTQETIEEGKRLFKKVNRSNVMFKVPATEPGFLAIEEFLSNGMNINITLIFSVQQYVNTVKSYIRGLRKFSNKALDLSGVRSVASIFVSRIDTAIDKRIDEVISRETSKEKKDKLSLLKGKAAVANSWLVYKKWIKLFSSVEFEEVAKKGANKQRILWASTGTKNPAFSDIMYITELIAPDTVNTMPESTFNAFLDHGNVVNAVPSNFDGAKDVLSELGMYGININNICNELLEAGLVSFENSFNSLLSTIEQKANTMSKV
ncbi:MAG: transaldolase [bacterium]